MAVCRVSKLTVYFAAIPKEHTVFRFTVPLPGVTEAEAGDKGDSQEKATPGGSKPLVFELHGSQFENRPVDRANKKFKWRNIDYI
jgi:ribonuclease P protein subunit POP4